MGPFTSSRRLPVAALAPFAMVALVACKDASAPTARAEPRATSSARTAFVPVVVPSDAALLEVPARALVGRDSEAAIAATFPLRIVQVYVQPGDAVEANAPIVEVSSAEVLEAAARYIESSKGVRAHGERLETLRPLHEERVVPTERVFEVERRSLELEGDARQALAVLRAAGVPPSQAASVLRRGTIVLRSPIAGVVREVDAVRGAVRENGGTFAQVVGGRSSRIEARFPSAVPRGFRYSFEDLRGRRVELGTSPSRTLEAGEEGGVIAWFDLPEGTDVAAGSPGHLRAEPEGDAYVEVPATALETRGRAARVLRQRGDETRAVPVEVASSSGSAAIVSGDLRVGDQVARDGATALEQAEGSE